MNKEREFKRVSENVNIKWSKGADQPTNASFCEDLTLDISGGGVCFIVYEKLDIGNELNLELALPTGKNIRTKAKVIWVNDFKINGELNQQGYSVGVQFIDISQSDREELKDFVSKHAK